MLARRRPRDNLETRIHANAADDHESERRSDGAVTTNIQDLRVVNPDLLERESTHAIIGAFFDVYNLLGYGFLEHVYSLALERDLVARGRMVGREVSIPIRFRGEVLTTQRVDMIVDEKIVVEIKSTFVLPPTAKRQLLNYLRATNLEVALLLHFGPDAKFYRLVQSNELKQR
jgi:GxxExxY protein